MDWRYLMKLSPEGLTEEAKDELLSVIAWYDLEEEDVDFRKSMTLLRISQEIMKYKAEQVEALLAELDEIATKQGEEEAKKQESSDYDAKSMRSKASGGVDIDEIENKHRDLKVKYKKLQKVVEKSMEDNEKLKQNVNMLEKERQHLQNELQHTHQDESSSDISETVKDQQRGLIDSIHQKNNQISQLLTDIENIESDNLLLRNKLTTVRDELSDATEKLQLLISETEISNVKLQEMSEIIDNLKAENESLKIQVEDIIDDKKQREVEFEQFAQEVDVRIDGWKKVLDDKNSEIARLKSKLPDAPMSRTSSSSSVKEDTSQLNALHGAINDREGQIKELKHQLETATKEMEENTEIIKKLTIERDVFSKKYEKSNVFAKDLRKQLKAVHNRCQELQEEVAYQESIVELKNNEVQDLLEKIRDGDGVSDKEIFTEMHDLKSQNRLREKQITDLVRTCNKLQESVDNADKENTTLRERLGLSEDDYVSTKSASSQQRRQRKLIQDLKREIAGFDEERLEFRLEVQKLSKIIANLSDQIIELGETPNPEHVQLTVPHKLDEANNIQCTPQKTSEDQNDACVSNEKQKAVDVSTKNSNDVKTKETEIEDVKKPEERKQEKVDDGGNSERYKAVVEENEALRKGLHEILDSVRAKQETSVREIKSDTLESLLRALDVKHISGWYHPAMRLQAELHALQGSNGELREQLRVTREELEKYKEHVPSAIFEEGIHSEDSKSSGVVIGNLHKHLVNVLKNYHLEEQTNSELIKKLENYKTEFTTIQSQVGLLYAQYFDEKQQWESQVQESDKLKTEHEEKSMILEAKLNTITQFLDPKTDDDLKMRKAAEAAAHLVILNRKCVYLENQETIYRQQVAELKDELMECETTTLAKINILHEENGVLTCKLKTSQAKNGLDSREVEKIRNDYDNLIIKERRLLRTLEDVRKVNENDLVLLKRRVELLEDEKKELEVKLLEALSYKNACVDKNAEILAKKLAQSEVNEITEKQRANHTNNLYELVKEQLQKSEERYKEYQKYNNEIMHKNLILQESLKELENKIVDYVDLNVFRILEDEHLKLLKTQERLVAEKVSLEGELVVCRRNTETRRLWVDLERQEFLNLKHQIVDLQSTSDDKAVIARLSSDVVISRTAEAETRRKLVESQLDLMKSEEVIKEFMEAIEAEKIKNEGSRNGLEKKVKHLEVIVRQQRHHYIGYIPFISEYKFMENIRQVYEDKKEAYENLQQSEDVRNESELLKHTWEAKNNILNELNDLLQKRDQGADIIEAWYQDKSNVQLKGLRFRKQAEFKDSQLQDAISRLKKQETIISTLEYELLQSLSIKEDQKHVQPVRDLRKTTSTIVEITPNYVKDATIHEITPNYATFSKSVETQTYLESSRDNDNTMHNIIMSLESELSVRRGELEAKDQLIQQMKLKITELEMNISLFRQQIGDKQSQITFYEKHIMEMQQKKEVVGDGGIDTTHSGGGDDGLSLKTKLKELQDSLSDKETVILKYQSLLKRDRDEHSLAAARFQDDIKQLQIRLIRFEEEKDQQKSQVVEARPSRAAIEHYILQVHALEKHTAELHTNVASLNSQLQASRQECVRWRSLAYDRLQNMEELQVSLEEQHNSELSEYKNECDKWREEVKSLQLFISKYKKDISELRPDIEKEMKEKDNKIHELTVVVRQLKSGMKRKVTTTQPTSSREENFEEIKEGLIREHDVLKKRFEQLMNREKSAREEIRILKGQLMKRPVLSARSDSSTTKEQNLQRKVTSLEKEIEDLKEKLEREVAMNDARKIKVNEDFERWSKQKYWQQTSEKLKLKLKERGEEYEKLQQTCGGYRILIERLEREKHSLENRIKSIKTHSTNVGVVRSDLLASDNLKLMVEVEALREKLEAQHRHSGGLGAVMLEEKLEAQERKIAILEMSAKGGVELRAELERLQSANSVYQKSNLRLEAENLDLRLDLERSSKELPHLREQILHLESYVEVLKSEKVEHEVSCSGDHAAAPQVPEAKRVSELERTVFVLKRIVEKLQVENKRLQGGSKPCSDRVGSSERLRREHRRLQEQCGEAAKRIVDLERQLAEAASGSDSGVSRDLEDVRGQLKQKTQLLEKVKVLLQRAAGKEKALLEQVTSLKAMIPREMMETSGTSSN